MSGSAKKNADPLILMKEYTYINVMGRTALKSGILDRLRAIMQPYTDT